MSQATAADNEALRAFAVAAARLLCDRHCEDVRLIDVRTVSQVCDYMLIASGTSDRQMKSIAAELGDLGEEMGQPCFRSNRDTGVTWVVVDFIDLVAHIFEPRQREYYALEELWSDGRPVVWDEGRPSIAAPAGGGSETEGARELREEGEAVE